MGIYRRNKTWYIDYYYEGKRIRERVGPRKKDAEYVLAIRKAEILQGRYDMQSTKKNVLFGRFSREYIEYAKINKKSWKRDITSLKNILPIFENKRLHYISSFDIDKYKSMRRKKVKPATVNRELALMKHMFNLAIKWGMAKNNPVRGVKFFKEQNQRIRFLTEEEIVKLIERCAPQLKSVVITALNTGMRKGEFLGLTWNDIDFENNIIYLDDSKGGNSRQIPINDLLKEVLLKLKSKSTSENIFLNKLGKPYRDVLPAFKRALKKAEINNFRFHDLRHTFASHLAMMRTPIHTIMELLGHKTLYMAMRYAHLSEGYKKQTLNNLQRKIFNSHKMDTNKEVENSDKPANY